MDYPLTLRFKIIAFAPQIFIDDANGNPVCYVRQKLFKFREQVDVFTDRTKSTTRATIQANKVLDWSARYNFAMPDGTPIGSVGRKGLRSLWKAHYEVFNPGDEVHDFTISEENPGAKFFDSILGGIPILGMLTAFLFHPRYLATRADGSPAMRLSKKPAFWEGKFAMEKLGELTPQEEYNLMLSFLMLVLLERQRG